jgi:hypothetical protein
VWPCHCHSKRSGNGGVDCVSAFSQDLCSADCSSSATIIPFRPVRENLMLSDSSSGLGFGAGENADPKEDKKARTVSFSAFMKFSQTV